MSLIKKLIERFRKLAAFPPILEGGQAGFSLIEMLIVITLIGLVGTLVATNVMKRYDEAKFNATKIQIRQVGLALDDFRRVCGKYPTTDMGLDALIHQPAGMECKNYDPDGYWKDKKLPKDGWDRDFGYESDGNTYKPSSLGRDGKPGGDSWDRDLSNEDND